MIDLCVLHKSHSNKCLVCKDAQRIATHHLIENPGFEYARVVIESDRQRHSVIIERNIGR